MKDLERRLEKLEAECSPTETTRETIERESSARLQREYEEYIGIIDRILQTVPDLYMPLIEETLRELASKPDDQQYQFVYGGGFLGGSYGPLAKDWGGQGLELLKHVITMARRYQAGQRFEGGSDYYGPLCAPAATCAILIEAALCEVAFGSATSGCWECRECNYWMPQGGIKPKDGSPRWRELLLEVCPACGGEPTNDFHKLKNREP
jgi:hypothetical protein